jgi:hypothetical protein
MFQLTARARLGGTRSVEICLALGLTLRVGPLSCWRRPRRREGAARFLGPAMGTRNASRGDGPRGTTGPVSSRLAMEARPGPDRQRPQQGGDRAGRQYGGNRAAEKGNTLASDLMSDVTRLCSTILPMTMPSTSAATG